MDVIDRYFRTLRILLPKEQRDDIVRELSEEVESQIAEKENALGRPLDQSERAAIIAQYGHPLLTAARYRPPRSLIGPVVFPYYWIVLRVALGLVALGHVLGALVLVVADTPGPPAGTLVAEAIETALKVAAWITALGAIADIAIVRTGVLQRWTPPSGPSTRHAQRVIDAALSKVPGSPRGTPSASPRRVGAHEPSIVRLAIGLVVGVWWLAGLRFPSLFFGPGAADLAWGPAMTRLYPVLVIAQLTMFAEQFGRYFWPDQGRLFRVTRLVWLTAGIALIVLVASSDHQWMVWQHEAVRGGAAVVSVAGRVMSLIEFVNAIWSIVFIVVAVLGVWGVLKAALRRFRGPMMTAHA